MKKTKAAGALAVGAALVAAGLLTAGPADAATVNAAHVDIVSVKCTPNAAHTAYTLTLGTNIETPGGETFVPAASASSEQFHYDASSSYVQWTPTTGSAGYYDVVNDSAEQSEIPWIGFAYDEDDDCGGFGFTFPSITVKLTKATGSNRIWANPAAGVLDTDASPVPSITLNQHDHQHTEWRYYGSSHTAQSYKPTFTVSGAVSGTLSPTISVG